MSSASRATQKASPSTRLEIIRQNEKSQFFDEFRGLVAKRAYDLFEQFGRPDGNDVSHWLQAENELATALPEVRESDGSYKVNVALPGISADKIIVCSNEDRAIISAENSSKGSDGGTQDRRSIYYMVRWPENVDPETCDAEMENGKLTLTARKAKRTEDNSPSH